MDEDGNITESSYKAITKDTNDKVYAVIEDYLVKALVIEDVDDGKAPEVTEGNGTFDVTVSKNQAGELEVNYVANIRLVRWGCLTATMLLRVIPISAPIGKAPRARLP